MLDLSRREALMSAAGVALAAGVPSWALAQAAAGRAAGWDLQRNLPDRRRVGGRPPGDPRADSVAAAVSRASSGAAPLSLRAALQAQSDLNKRASRLYTYASLKADEDLRVAPNQERKQPGAGRVHGARRGDGLDQPGNRRSRRGQGRTPSSRPTPGSNKFAFGLRDIAPPGAAHPVAGRGKAARVGRNAAGGPQRHSRPAGRVRHPAADGQAQRRARNPARRPGLYDRPRSAEPRRPQDGLRQVLGELQGVRELARDGARRAGQGRHVPGQGAQVRQRAPGGARRQQSARSGLSHR